MEEREHDWQRGLEQPPAPDTERPAAYAQWEHATPPVAWWRRRPVQLGAVTAVVVAAAIGIWLTVGGSKGTAASASSTPIPAPTSLLLEGRLDLSFGTTFSPNAVDPAVAAPANPRLGDSCTALGGYGDITEGAAVTIGDGSGSTLAVVALAGGNVAVNDQNNALCRFLFSAEVPSGHGTYTVTISHRGTQVFTEMQVASEIELTLGN